MTKKQYGAQLAKVRELTARQTGASLPETAEGIGKSMNVASVYIAALVKAGEIIRSGPHGEYRYFKDTELAAAHDVVAQAARLEQIEETRKRKNQQKSAKQKAERAKARAERGQAPIGQAKKVRKKYASTKAKKTSSSLYMRDKAMEYIQTAKDQVKKHQTATIIWPESVKVQRIPTPEDVRFKAAPGYIGPFTLEYQERRAA